MIDTTSKQHKHMLINKKTGSLLSHAVARDVYGSDCGGFTLCIMLCHAM